MARAHLRRVRPALPRGRHAVGGAGVRALGVVALHPRHHGLGRGRRDGAQLPRGGDRAHPAGPAHRVHPDDLRRVPAPRALGVAPHGARGGTRDPLGDHRDRRLGPGLRPARRPLAGVGGVVHRAARDAHDADDPQLLPDPDPRADLGGVGRRGPRRGRAVQLGGRPARLAVGGALHPVGVARAPRPRGLLPRPLPAGPRRDRADRHHARRVRARARPPGPHRRATHRRPGPGVARLRGVARQLRRDDRGVPRALHEPADRVVDGRRAAARRAVEPPRDPPEGRGVPTSDPAGA